MRHFIAALAIVGGLSSLPTPTIAQSEGPKCFQLEALERALEERYDEQAIWIGLMEGGEGGLALYQSEEGSWTLIRVQPSGVGCIVASGEGAVDLRKPSGLGV